MRRSLTMVVLFNIFWGFTSAFLYLGSSVDFQVAKANLPASFFTRFLPFWIVGILFWIVVIGVSFLVGFNKPTDQRNQLLRLLLYAVVITTISCLIGVSSFFWV